MLRKTSFTLVAVLMLAPAARPQDGTFELSASYGYTLVDGVTFQGLPIGGEVFNRIDPQDSGGFNATFGYFVQESPNTIGTFGSPPTWSSCATWRRWPSSSSRAAARAPRAAACTTRSTTRSRTRCPTTPSCVAR